MGFAIILGVSCYHTFSMKSQIV